jgi:hypothetical protein
MLEQLRENRRKRQARMLAFSILATLGVLLLVVIIFTLRSCFGGTSAPRIVASELPESAAPTASAEAGVIPFRPAPLYTALDSAYLVTAMASQSTDSSAAVREVEKLVAYGIADGKQVWERPINDFLNGMLVSGGHAIVYREGDLGFSARAFRLEDGSPAWNFEIDGAQNISIARDGSRLALGYSLTDGFRIAIYDAKNGVKSSGRMLQKADNTYMDFSSLNMQFVGNRLLYTLDRSVGMLDFENDKFWSAEGSAAVLLASPDIANGQVYVLSRGNGQHSLVLHMRNFSNGAEKELDRIETAADAQVMVADNGYLLLAYSDLREDGHYDTTVRCFKRDSRDPYVRQTVTGMRVEDAMPLSEGLFILGLNRSTGKADNPVHGGELQLVNPGDGSIREFASLRPDIEYTIRFGEDRLVLMGDGEVLRIDLASSGTQRVRKMAHSALMPVFSADYDVFGVLSYPPDSTPGDNKSRMQVLILH